MELDHYEINVETLLIIPFGKGKSKVYEMGDELIVDMTPLAIIKESCLYFGCSYEGRREGTKSLIGVDMKVPILIEDSRNIIFFPVSSCINKNSIWISYKNLIKYEKYNEFSTVLYFRENKKINISGKFSLVDNQIIRCIKLDSLLTKRKEFFKSEGILIES